jgi:signal transduction histidine kinase/DNA-binding NarL/FixJ family response regulator
VGVLSLIYFQISLEMAVDRRALIAALWKVSFLLMILCGVVAWMFVLVHSSRKVAQEESQRQTLRLMDEIAAHEATDLELQKAKETAEAANLAKSRYLTGISHELRSPLNAVLGYAQLLERDPALPESNRTAIGVIRRSGEYLADLIEGLLDISRIEAGRLELHSGEVRLPLLLDQLGNLLRPQAEAKGIAFVYECADRLPEFVRTDEKRLRQILINLLSNAIKFTDAGSVTLRVGYRSQVAEFTVSDTGIGIAEIHRERIFRPFERIRETGSRQVPGTGLGLTITRLLVDILGGDLSFTSEPGRGSSFRVALMLSRVERPAALPAVEPSIDGYRGERKTLLVIDDDPIHRRLVSDMLGPLGFTVVEAPDAATGLALAERQPPQLFLLDVAMPGLDGWQLAALLRARLPATPIIMVSADAREGMRDHRDPAPHDAYLVKPVRIQDLLDALGSCLQLAWHYRRNSSAVQPQRMQTGAGLAGRDRDELRRFAEIGYTKAFQAKLDSLEQACAAPAEFIAGMRRLAGGFEFGRIVQLLDGEP